MRVYTVHSSPSDGADGRADPLNLNFIKEGFSWPALVFPVLWLIYHRLWLVLVAYLVVFIGIGAAGEAVGGPVPGLVMAGLQLLLALEGNELRRWALARRGCTLAGLSAGATLQEAEIGFFATLGLNGSSRPEVSGAPPAEPTAARSAVAVEVPSDTEVGGLFPAPEGSVR
jgi:hypothetical protein